MTLRLIISRCRSAYHFQYLSNKYLQDSDDQCIIFFVKLCLAIFEYIVEICQVNSQTIVAKDSNQPLALTRNPVASGTHLPLTICIKYLLVLENTVDAIIRLLMMV